MCHQSVGLMSRAIEEAGIPTLSMTSARDITESVMPPRAVFLNFPLGHEAGKPHQPELQRSIIKDALRAVEILKEPGTIIDLPYRWLEDKDWEEDFLARWQERA